MTEEVRKAFEAWYLSQNGHTKDDLTTVPDDDMHIEQGDYYDLGARMMWSAYSAAAEHQQKRIDNLTNTLKEIKVLAGGSDSDDAEAMDSQLCDVWLKADEALEEQNND